MPPEIQSSTGILSLSFHTDMAVAKDGFAARYNMTHKEVNEGKMKFFYSFIYLFIYFSKNIWSKSFPLFFPPSVLWQLSTAAKRSVWSPERSPTTRSRPRPASTMNTGCRSRPDSTTTTTGGRPTKTATESTYRYESVFCWNRWCEQSGTHVAD